MYKFERFTEKLEALRIYRGYKSQNKVAVALGMSRQQYNNYASGKTDPSIETILKICNTLKIDFNYFVSTGKIEHYDLDRGKKKSKFTIPFVETRVARKLLALCQQAREDANTMIVYAYSSSGTTISLKEYLKRHKGGVIIDAAEKLEKPLKGGIRLYIIDHGEQAGKEELESFINLLEKDAVGVVVVASRSLKLSKFIPKHYLPELSLKDIEKIAETALPAIEEIAETDAVFRDKVLMTITSEVFFSLRKLEKLRKILSEGFFQNFSLHYLFEKLSEKEKSG